MPTTEANKLVLLEAVELRVSAQAALEVSYTILRALRHQKAVRDRGAPTLTTYRGRPQLLAASIDFYEVIASRTIRTPRGTELPN
jgi:hypothetical protein